MVKDREAWHPWGRKESNRTSVQFSYSVVSDSLQTHGLQHARPPCPSLSLRVYSNSCPLSQWCHPTISCSCHLLLLPSIFPASESFPMSQPSPSSGQRIGASASAFPVNIQDWFPLELTSLISLLWKGLPRIFSSTTILFHAQPSLWSNFHPYMTTGKP